MSGRKREILKIVEFYVDGKYNTEIFCDMFTEAYYFENSGYRCFHGEQRKALDELAQVAERFSPYEDDIKKCGDYYITEQEVRNTVEKAKHIIFDFDV